MIQKMNEFVNKNQSFAFETTFSGKEYGEKIRKWKSQNYEVIIYYLKLPSVNLAIERVKLRVAQVGMKNILALTGHYTGKGFGGQGAPVFDIDSVLLLCQLSMLNNKSP